MISRLLVCAVCLWLDTVEGFLVIHETHMGLLFAHHRIALVCWLILSLCVLIVVDGWIADSYSVEVLRTGIVIFLVLSTPVTSDSQHMVIRESKFSGNG